LKYKIKINRTKSVQDFVADIISRCICLKKIEKKTPNNNTNVICKNVIYKMAILLALDLYFGL